VPRESTLFQYTFLGHLKFRGFEKENQGDPVRILSSLKNGYGIIRFAVTVEGEPVPNAMAVR
jgi:hypothetical protein